MDPWTLCPEFLSSQTRLLLASYHRWTGRDLIRGVVDPVEQARLLWEAPFVVVSGGDEAEQVLNYGNAAALALWETDWATLTRMPSRQTAEPVHQKEREVFLQRVREFGYVDDYSGVRISAKGRRFRIEQAVVWNVVGDDGVYLGQAATFSRWTPI
ncbi:MAG: MEKHLA domain-containing protein [Candidatus Methylacidiphilales bacterium]|nr:MEKHLA domain-containing protein [Candidatus Methylacidiphilales bacterium]